MAIPAQLSRTLHLALGEHGADDMVDWMNRVDDQRAELRELNELSVGRLEARMGQVEARIGQVEVRIGQVEARIGQVEVRIGQVEAKLDGRIGQLESKFSADLRVCLKEVEAKIDRRFGELIKWSFVFWCGAVAVAALAR